MDQNIHISQEVSVFHGRQAPESGTIVGYGALIESYKLPVPFPARLALIRKNTANIQQRTGWYLPQGINLTRICMHTLFSL